MSRIPFGLLRPALFALDPETAHDLTLKALKNGLGGSDPTPDDPMLAVERFGLKFSNPVGLAAGFDKNAEVPDAMLRLGFGFTEIGTVTPKAQPGNPKPRIFRLPFHEGVINRLGFNNEGLDPAVARLTARARKGIVGGNIGRNKDQTDAVADYAEGARRLSPLVDYLTVNVSSPNTPGLRDLQAKAALLELLWAVKEARRAPVPVLLKIAPDLDQAALEDVAAAAIETAIDGIIISNTTILRPPGLPDKMVKEAGGLSGRPLYEVSTTRLKQMYRITAGKIPLIGVGGICGPGDAYRKIRAGASLVQLYTALIFQGPELVTRIKQGLAIRLKRDGFARVSDAVGCDAR